MSAIHRLIDPPQVRAGLVLGVALAGAAVNLAAALTLSGAEPLAASTSRAASSTSSTDLYGFLGTAIAAVVILATGFERADPIASLAIAALMIRSGDALVIASARDLPRGRARGARPAGQIGRRRSCSQPGVIEVHDLHVWEVTSGFPALSAHVLVDADSDCHARAPGDGGDAARALRARPHDPAGRPRRRRAAGDRALGRPALARRLSSTAAFHGISSWRCGSSWACSAACSSL